MNFTSLHQFEKARFMKKILVANRGEIALRVMRSAHEMGIATVAIFSDADREAPHVRYADEAVNIGPSPSSQSYLLSDKVIEIAKKLKVDAIHPGYGFLSENAGFARKVQRAGITFIGPGPHSIKLMGNKLAAKSAVSKFNIPMVPGTGEAISDVKKAAKEAKKIGFPVLLKAAAGGGGKGMRVVNKSAEFEEQMKRAVSEAQASFGDGSVFIEKYIAAPRHIEIQVLADTHSNIVHLFERECSIQRRHQKVIEEAPSAVLTKELREQMGQSAIDVARSCKYVGAGTVEFLVDEKLNYYFLEMNTRLQVEHPVTEMITGIDLVKEQIRIAQGKKIGFSQEDLAIKGHTIELRVYAEDPSNNFLPDTGNLKTYKRPQGPGVRVDDGFEEGMDIPIYYDPMIGKLITHGKDRKEAIQRMIRAIDEFSIVGIKNTLSFGKLIMNHPQFKKGKLTTHFIEDHFKPEQLSHYDKTEAEVAALLVAELLSKRHSNRIESSANPSQTSKWKKNRLDF